MLMTRKNAICGIGASIASIAIGSKKPDLVISCDPDVLQKEIDEVTPNMYAMYRKSGNAQGKRALLRLDDAYHKVFKEVESTKVEDKPAAWLIYNMGIVVKTRETLFTIDLNHRLAPKIAKKLDFALVTHNHGDHCPMDFYKEMNSTLKKTVVNNFIDNYAAHFGKRSFGGGFTRGGKSFKFRDVEITTSALDHNGYLIDYTLAFEVRIGDFTIYHTGDTSNIKKLNPMRRPDLWVVHPRCGVNVTSGVKKFGPKNTVIAHLNEMGHAKGNARWTWGDGFKEKKKVEALGFQATVPFWGDRIC